MLFHIIIHVAAVFVKHSWSYNFPWQCCTSGGQVGTAGVASYKPVWWLFWEQQKKNGQDDRLIEYKQRQSNVSRHRCVSCATAQSSQCSQVARTHITVVEQLSKLIASLVRKLYKATRMTPVTTSAATTISRVCLEDVSVRTCSLKYSLAATSEALIGWRNT